MKSDGDWARVHGQHLRRMGGGAGWSEAHQAEERAAAHEIQGISSST